MMIVFNIFDLKLLNKCQEFKTSLGYIEILFQKNQKTE
jgi:hypothetical protein